MSFEPRISKSPPAEQWGNGSSSNTRFITWNFICHLQLMHHVLQCKQMLITFLTTIFFIWKKYFNQWTKIWKASISRSNRSYGRMLVHRWSIIQPNLISLLWDGNFRYYRHTYNIMDNLTFITLFLVPFQSIFKKLSDRKNNQLNPKVSHIRGLLHITI